MSATAFPTVRGPRCVALARSHRALRTGRRHRFEPAALRSTRSAPAPSWPAADSARVRARPRRGGGCYAACSARRNKPSTSRPLASLGKKALASG